MRKLLCCCGLVLVLLMAMVVGIAFVMHKSLGVEVVLPVIAISGVVVLLVVLALVAVAFSKVNLADRTEALGLPPGSVRGVLALSLVVLFAILSVFLFGALNDAAPMGSVSCLTEQQRIATLANLAGRSGVTSVQTADQLETGQPCSDLQRARDATSNAVNEAAKMQEGPAKAAKEAEARSLKQAEDVTSKGLYRVYWRDPGNPAATDFAKQLLVLIGTLVTAVASFYFGSKASSEAQALVSGASGPPAPRSVSPTPVNRGSDGVWVTVTGTSLNDVKQIQLERAGATATDPKRVIRGTEVVSNVDKAQAKFTLGSDVAIGAWDVVLTDGAGRSATLAASLTIEDAAPAPAALAPTSAVRGNPAPIALTITGKSLGAVKQVQIKSGTKTVDATSVEAAYDKVDAKVVIGSDALPGAWDVVVTDAAGRSASLSKALTVAAVPPVPGPVSPSAATRGSKFDLTVTGTDLADVQHVRMTSGTRTIEGTDVKSGASSASATMQVAPTDPIGAWEVFVVDSAGRTVKATGQVNVA